MSRRWRSARTAGPWLPGMPPRSPYTDLWRTRTGHRPAPRHRRSLGVLAMQFSPDGKTLATGDYGAFTDLWDTAAGTAEPRSPRREQDHRGSPRWRSARTAGPWPSATIIGGYISVGHRDRAPDRRPCGRGFAAGARRWCSARTARPWPPATATAARCCGTPRPGTAEPRSPAGIAAWGHGGGVQPGRQDPGHRRQRRPDLSVGHRDRAADRQAHRARVGAGDGGGVQPGRQDPGHRRQRRPDLSVGHRDRAADRQAHRARVGAGHGGGVQPGRQDPGHRRLVNLSTYLWDAPRRS